MQSVNFPVIPESSSQTPEGAQAIFRVEGATTTLASFMNHHKEEIGLRRELGWEIVVTELRPDQVMVICNGDVGDSEFKQGMVRIASWGQHIPGSVLENFEREREEHHIAMMATPSVVGSFGDAGA